MIEIRDVTKSYGTFRALDGCTTSVAKGSVVIVSGPSESGKSTLIRCVNGLERVDSGSIVVDNVVVTAPNTNLAKLSSRIGMVFQSFELFPRRSVLQNLDLAQVEVLRRELRAATERSMALLEDRDTDVFFTEPHTDRARAFLSKILHHDGYEGHAGHGVV